MTTTAVEHVEELPRANRRRFSVAQLMLLTAIATLFVAALLHENQWWRATLFTATVAMIFNEILGTIYATGDRRAFAIGHSVAALLMPFSAYGAALTLPFLITTELLKVIDTWLVIDDTNYLIVMGIFWVQVTCRASGYLGVTWYRRSREAAEKAQL